MSHVEFVHIDGHEVAVTQDNEGVLGSCVCGVFVTKPTLIKVEDAIRELHLRKRIDDLIVILEHEKRRPTSCTPDLVRRFEKAMKKHRIANSE